MNWPRIREWYNHGRNRLVIRRPKIDAECLPQQMLVLLRHITVHGVEEEQYRPLTVVNIQEIKKLKRHLLAENAAGCSQYSIEASIIVLRSFLRHLSRPLLHKDLHRDWAAVAYDIRRGHKNDAAVVQQVRRLLQQISVEELRVVRSLSCAIRALTFRLGYCDTPRLTELTQYLGPTLTSGIIPNLPFKKPCKVGPVILKFLVNNADDVFATSRETNCH